MRRLAFVSALGLALVAGPAFASGSILVSGDATYRERMLLPEGAVLEVRLEDQSRADAQAPVIASFDGPARTSPTPFSVSVDPGSLVEGATYGWRASIRLEDELLFTTDTHLPFERSLTSGVSLPMVRVAAQQAAGLSLQGRWLAEDIEGGGVLDRVQTTFEVAEDGRASGSGGCNRYSGQAQISGGSIEMGNIAATMMACAPAQMDQEGKFFAALGEVRGFEIDQARRKLTLSDATGQPKVVFARMD